MKASKYKKYLASAFLFLLIFGIASPSVFAKETETGHSFEPGEYIMHHVSDAFEWHLFSYGETHVSVPLPIILYSNNSGWHFFWSSKFHHGQESYRNFRIAHEGENAGKIEEINAQGKVAGLPIDLSITKAIAGAIFSVFLLLWIFIGAAKSAKRNAGGAPRGILNAIEPLILFIRDEVAKPAIGNKKYEKFMPFLLSLFFFILLNNLMGLIPIFPFGANVTGNIAVTMVLALFTFFVTHINANKHYWKEIYNPDVPWWLKFPVPMMPIVELAGVFTKPFVLMVRLFANMMAGHMIVTVFVSLIFIFGKMLGATAGMAISPVSIAFSVFILMLDLLVSFIQAYVFTLLAALYFGMATSEHH
jgi:F-type H+-transporting ATPase subunit a